MQKEKCMVRHIRDFVTRKPIGTMVAVDFGKEIGTIVGFCFCNPKDHFNKKKGIEIAYGRAVKGSEVYKKVPKRDITVPLVIFDNDKKIVVDYAITNLQEVFPEILAKFCDKADRYFGRV